MSLAVHADALDQLVGRYDSELFWPMRPDARIRLRVEGLHGAASERDVVFEADRAFLLARRGRPDAIIEADQDTWAHVLDDVRGGLQAFHAGRLRIRRDLHLGIGFLAATAGAPQAPGAAPALHFRQVRTAAGEISINEAGAGPAAILIHGLGATKVSLLPTLAALVGEGRHAVALDLPGFGDSEKPLRAAYDAAFFARAVVSLMDSLGIDRADLVGNSLGGRVAIEVALRFPERAGRLGLLAPSLAWLRGRPLAPVLRLVSPQLGLLQPVPRSLVERIAQAVIGDGASQWTAAGVDEFLRSYLTPRGRAAFYAAARHIYLEPPHGPRGLWTRLAGLRAPSLFVWGRRDTLVPIGFEAHVREIVPAAEHLELDCGHVPQLERPAETHAALARFLAAGE